MDIPTLTPDIIACRAVLHDFDEDHCAGSKPEMRAALVSELVQAVLPLARTNEERLAIVAVPRPGTWFGDREADGRWLTQAQTDQLVRDELFWLDSWGLAWQRTHGLDGTERKCVLGVSSEGSWRWENGIEPTKQRGGIDSDPLVRLLAFRALDSRDERWFEDRGVHIGEPLAVDERGAVHVLTNGQRDRRPPIGHALDDGHPGTLVRVQRLSGVMFAKVSERPRGQEYSEDQMRRQALYWPNEHIALPAQRSSAPRELVGVHNERRERLLREFLRGR